jgi:hypothetical protein
MAGSGAGLPYRARLRKASGTSGASDVIKDEVTPEVSGIAHEQPDILDKV